MEAARGKVGAQERGRSAAAPSETAAEVRGPIVAVKRRNGRGAKGARKVEP